MNPFCNLPQKKNSDSSKWCLQDQHGHMALSPLLRFGQATLHGLFKSGGILGKTAIHAAFLREFLREPRKIGSICQSGRALSNAIVQSALGAEPDDSSIIVDLGAGTGVISAQLLSRGINPRQIIAIDASAAMSRIFSSKFSDIRLIVNDAANIDAIIAQNCLNRPVRAIISSLPLRSLPQAKVASIMQAVRHSLLRHGGVLVQYTYAIWQGAGLCAYGFAFCSRKIIYSNLPPALVEVYRPV